MRWLLVDRIKECEPGKSATGIKNFSRSDEFFQDHFPGMPIVPGVLQIEMIAQMAGKCIALSQQGILPVLGSVKSAKFYHNVRPGDQCFIKVSISKVTSSYSIADGVIEVEGKKMSAATILFGHIPRENINSESFDAVTQDWLNSQKGNA